MSLRPARGSSAVAAVPDGSMPLLDHLRELRQRLFVSVVAIVVASIVAGLFYDQLLALLQNPFEDSVRPLAEEQDINAELTINTVSGPFTLLLKVSVVAGVVAASPIWLYQLWAFIVPGLHRNERRWSMVFGAVAGPLFITGVLIGYYVLPKGINILISFTPDEVSNLVELSGYLSFVLRMLLVFGVAFEIPLFVILLNLAGVVSGRQLGEHRPWIIIGTFIFAAIATPSTDPVSMLFLALPMTLLFFISEIIARLVDRRRRARNPEGAYDAWDDDEVSPLGPSQPLDDPDDVDDFDDFDDPDARPLDDGR
ncbi:MAG TPA: twin-arginine translocase subunit TatC [Nocardioidaceae bacterium]|nr:twin-arginine translocase subunit TatC [Nocardioidaceae bacterium]